MPGILFEKFIRTIKNQHLISQGDFVLISVSGGADSLALLHLLLEVASRYRLQLAVAHYNHRLRGKESEEDEQFVRQLAKDTGLDFFVGGDRERSLQHGSGNLEERARQCRHNFLLESAQKIQAQKIALGHTSDDQAETILMRLLRGSGSVGLGGIPPVRQGLWIRPLLRISRREILDYLNEKKVTWREDSSNAGDAHLRNRIRHHLLPWLEKEYNPNLRNTLSETADTLREESEALRILACTFLKKFDSQRGVMELSLEELTSQPRGLQTYILREILLGFSPSHLYPPLHQVRAILDLVSPGRGGKVLETSQITVKRSRKSLIFSRKS
jgi:tRNA(Ile)-lysidine synthase